MYDNEVNKKERRKIISVAVAAAVLILVLLVAIIVVATKKNGGEEVGGTENTPVVIDEESLTETSEEESTGSEVGTVSTETVEVKPVVREESTNDKMPATITETGPEDLLPVAILLGILTMVGTTIVMKKSEK